MLIEIEVTQEDIDNGQNNKLDPFLCPIARASARKLVKGKISRSNGNYASVTPLFVRVGNTCYRLDDTTREIMKKFDETGKMTPFTFTLDSDNLVK